MPWLASMAANNRTAIATIIRSFLSMRSTLVRTGRHVGLPSGLFARSKTDRCSPRTKSGRWPAHRREIATHELG